MTVLFLMFSFRPVTKMNLPSYSVVWESKGCVLAERFGLPKVLCGCAAHGHIHPIVIPLCFSYHGRPRMATVTQSAPYPSHPFARTPILIEVAVSLMTDDETRPT